MNDHPQIIVWQHGLHAMSTLIAVADAAVALSLKVGCGAPWAPFVVELPVPRHSSPGLLTGSLCGQAMLLHTCLGLLPPSLELGALGILLLIRLLCISCWINQPFSHVGGNTTVAWCASSLPRTFSLT